MKDRLAGQTGAWTWGGVLALSVAVLPGVVAQADGGGWIAPVLVLPGLLLVERLLKPVGTDGLACGLCRLLGVGLGRALTIIYIMWATILGGTQLWGSVRRAQHVAVPAYAAWVWAAGMVLLALWLVRGKAAACPQWAGLMLNGLLAILGGITLLALVQVRSENLLPLWMGGKKLAGAASVTFGLLCVRIYGAFVPGGAGRRGVGYPALVCALLGGLLLAVQGNLGTALAARLEDPALTLSRNVGIEGAFQRAESLLTAALLVADLVLVTLLLRASVLAAQQAWQTYHSGWILPTMGAIMFVIAALPIEKPYVQQFRQQIVPGVNFVLGLIVPLLAAAVGWARGKTRAYLVPESEEKGTY